MRITERHYFLTFAHQMTKSAKRVRTTMIAFRRESASIREEDVVRVLCGEEDGGVTACLSLVHNQNEVNSYRKEDRSRSSPFQKRERECLKLACYFRHPSII